MKKIAVPIINGNVSTYIMHGTRIQLYDVEQNEIVGIAEQSADINLAKQLRIKGVDALVCGMLPDGLRRDLAMAGVAVFAGIYGNADEMIRLLLENKLPCEPDTAHGFFAGHYRPCDHK